MIWQPQWQKEIGVTPEQQKALAEIKSKALVESKQQTEHFENLSAEERKAEVKSRSGKPAPWRQELDDQVRNQIETILTPTQLRVLKEYSFPRYAVSRLYDADLRRQIDFSPQQAEQFHQLTKERMATFQEQYLVHVDAVWGILTPQQRDALPEMVRQHLLKGPTGAAIAVGYDLGFDFSLVSPNHPTLAEAPVRNRLGLSNAQDHAVVALMMELAEKKRKNLPQQPPSDHEVESPRLAATLNPQQLKLLEDLELRRNVVRALNCSENREAVDMTKGQQTELEGLDLTEHEVLYRIDCQMLDKALTILTSSQKEQLRAEMDKRVGATGK
jgi:hypothetical protein